MSPGKGLPPFPTSFAQASYFPFFEKGFLFIGSIVLATLTCFFQSGGPIKAQSKVIYSQLLFYARFGKITQIGGGVRWGKLLKRLDKIAVITLWKISKRGGLFEKIHFPLY